MRQLIAATGLMVALALPAQAQEWPAKQVTLIVPFSAGGTTDLFGRLLSQHMQQKMGQPFIVENRAGAGGNLVEPLARLRHERRPQQQVFGRISRECQLREGNEVAPGRIGLLVRREEPVRVALEVTDHEVQLRGGHPHSSHPHRIRRPSARLIGWWTRTR